MARKRKPVEVVVVIGENVVDRRRLGLHDQASGGQRSELFQLPHSSQSNRETNQNSANAATTATADNIPDHGGATDIANRTELRKRSSSIPMKTPSRIRR